MTATFRGLTKFRVSDGEDGQTNYATGYRLWVDTPPETSTLAAVRAALAAQGIERGEACPFDAGAVCKEIALAIPARARKFPEGDRWEWSADVTFSSRLRKDAPPTNEKNPLLRRPSISVEGQSFDVVADRDVDTGEPVVNSAGSTFVRTRKRARASFKIEKAFASLDWRLLGDWESGGLRYTRNLAEWEPAGPYSSILGASAAAPGTAWMVGLSGKLSFDQNEAFVVVSAEIHYDVGEFQDVLVDEGFYWLDDDGAKRAFLVDGQFAQKPQPLDGAGGRLADGDPLETVAFQYYHTADWSVLPLP